MRSIELGATGIRTSVLGFGCAGLYRLPRRAERLQALDAAYEAGIRHFDLAPMYGFGRAEVEFGEWSRGKGDDVVVATKFGIEPSAVGRLAGKLQGPVRSVLAARPRIGEELKTSARGPGAGTLGRLLYSSIGYSPLSAAASLDRSLRAIGADHVDLFLLHDPVGDLRGSAPDLIAHLEDECSRGRIRAWGIAGEQFEFDPGLRTLQDGAPLLQFRDDVFQRSRRFGTEPSKGRITFGALGHAMAVLLQYFADSPQESATWCHRLGNDPSHPQSLASLLVQQALARNPDGVVLFTSTKSRHIHATAASADTHEADRSSGQSEVFDDLVAMVRSAKLGSE